MLYEDYNVDPALNTAPPPIGAPETTTKLKNTNEIDRRMMAAIKEIGEWVEARFGDLGTMADQDATAVNIDGGTIDGCTVSSTNTIDGAALKTGTIPAARLPIANDAARFGTFTPQQWYNIIYPIGKVVYLVLKRLAFPDPPPNVVATWQFISTVRYPKCLPYDDYTGSPGSLQVGGATTAQTTQAGGHDHTGKVTPTTLTVNQMPKHRHNVPSGGTLTGQTTGYRSEATVQNDASQQTDEVGGGQPHDHGIPPVADHTHNVALEPAWVAVQMWVRTA